MAAVGSSSRTSSALDLDHELSSCLALSASFSCHPQLDRIRAAIDSLCTTLLAPDVRSFWRRPLLQNSILALALPPLRLFRQMANKIKSPETMELLTDQLQLHLTFIDDRAAEITFALEEVQRALAYLRNHPEVDESGNGAVDSAIRNQDEANHMISSRQRLHQMLQGRLDDLQSSLRGLSESDEEKLPIQTGAAAGTLNNEATSSSLRRALNEQVLALSTGIRDLPLPETPIHLSVPLIPPVDAAATVIDQPRDNLPSAAAPPNAFQMQLSESFWEELADSPPSFLLDFQGQQSADLARFDALAHINSIYMHSLQQFIPTAISIDSRFSADVPRIPFSDMTVKTDTIGRGTFGAVHGARWNSKCLDVVVKKAAFSASLVKEVNILFRVRSPHMVHLYGICTDHNERNQRGNIIVWLIMERCLDSLFDRYIFKSNEASSSSESPASPMFSSPDFGSLFKIPWNASASSLPLGWTFAVDIARSIDFLHSHQPPLVHRDIKSMNFLVTKHNEVQLSDFGLSTENKTDMEDSAPEIVGTRLWMAPELLNQRRSATPLYEKVDIYAVGVTLMELLTKMLPTKEVKDQILKGDFQVLQDERLKALILIIRNCCADDPNQRPSAKQLIARISDQITLGQEAGFGRCQPEAENKQSEEQAFLLLRNAAARGNIMSQLMFIHNNANRDDIDWIEELVSWYRAAIQEGRTDSNEKDRGLPAERLAALKWFRNRLGDYSANAYFLFKVGQACLSSGHSGDETLDKEEAFEWLLLAAQQYQNYYAKEAEKLLELHFEERIQSVRGLPDAKKWARLAKERRFELESRQRIPNDEKQIETQDSRGTKRDRHSI